VAEIAEVAHVPELIEERIQFLPLSVEKYIPVFVPETMAIVEAEERATEFHMPVIMEVRDQIWPAFVEA
jgi:hypothetical protein